MLKFSKLYGNNCFNSKMTVYLYTHVSSWLVILWKKNSQFFGQFLWYCTCKGYIVFYRLHYSRTLYWYKLNIGNIFKTYQYTSSITPLYNKRKRMLCVKNSVFLQGFFLWAFRKLFDLTLTFHRTKNETITSKIKCLNDVNSWVRGIQKKIHKNCANTNNGNSTVM